MRRNLRLAAASVVLAMLAACGIKGEPVRPVPGDAVETSFRE
jgi:predicted small lipoprotein YifL